MTKTTVIPHGLFVPPTILVACRNILLTYLGELDHVLLTGNIITKNQVTPANGLPVTHGNVTTMPKRQLTPEARAKISAGAKARWKAQKKATAKAATAAA